MICCEIFPTFVQLRWRRFRKRLLANFHSEEIENQLTWKQETGCMQQQIKARDFCKQIFLLFSMDFCCCFIDSKKSLSNHFEDLKSTFKLYKEIENFLCRNNGMINNNVCEENVKRIFLL
jgi:hypothetical protein